MYVYVIEYHTPKGKQFVSMHINHLRCIAVRDKLIEEQTDAEYMSESYKYYITRHKVD
jgi:hypothetical protein